MDIAHKTLSSDDFLAWAKTQDEGKFELWRGEVVAMPPERHVHVLVESRAGFAPQAALDKAGLDCRVMIDGLAVDDDEDATFEPDILVACGPMPDRDSLFSNNPVIVVEVLSPGTRQIGKLNGYAQVKSIAHYLIIDPDKRIAVHQRRQGEARFDTALAREGRLRLDPPGVELAVEQLLPGEKAPEIATTVANRSMMFVLLLMT